MGGDRSAAVRKWIEKNPELQRARKEKRKATLARKREAALAAEADPVKRERLRRKYARTAKQTEKRRLKAEGVVLPTRREEVVAKRAARLEAAEDAETYLELERQFANADRNIELRRARKQMPRAEEDGEETRSA